MRQDWSYVINYLTKTYLVGNFHERFWVEEVFTKAERDRATSQMALISNHSVHTIHTCRVFHLDDDYLNEAHMNWVWTVKIYLFSWVVCAVNNFQLHIFATRNATNVIETAKLHTDRNKIIYTDCWSVSLVFFKMTFSVRGLLFDDVIAYVENKEDFESISSFSDWGERW